jgi:Uma2 family endonuclease
MKSVETPQILRNSAQPWPLSVEAYHVLGEAGRSKLRAYASAKVKEVWLVLVPERQIGVYRQPTRGSYATRRFAGPGGRLTPSSFPAFSLDLKAFFSKT